VNKCRAGILLYKQENDGIKVLLGFPGGPKYKDNGFWHIPKGKVEEGEDLFSAAKREFNEETGITPAGEFTELGSCPYKGDTCYIWGMKGDWNPEDGFTSNTVVMQWPPGTGKMHEFGELSDLRFFNIEDAKKIIMPRQKVFLSNLENKLSPARLNEVEPFQRAVKKKHRKMKFRLIGMGGNKKRERGHKKPSFKRSKSAPPGFGGS